MQKLGNCHSRPGCDGAIVDNLTHSLVGALLGQMGLKRKSGLAMPTLILAANIADVDALTTIYGIESLAMRRGITHGPLAFIVLPLLVWAAMLWFDSWQTKGGTRPKKRLAIHKGWLLALSYIGFVSHPILDWLNSYGIRFLEPFSSRWFYGDTLFIIDMWVWAILIIGLWVSLRWEKNNSKHWRWPARAMFVLICAYVSANAAITAKIESQAAAMLQKDYGIAARLVVANPRAAAFWQRDILWRSNDRHGHGFATVTFNGTQLFFQGKAAENGFADGRAMQAAKNNEEASAFLFWSRMPVVHEGTNNGSRILILADQRFSDQMVADRFRVEMKISQ